MDLPQNYANENRYANGKRYALNYGNNVDSSFLNKRSASSPDAELLINKLKSTI